jgi:hypothetical protein
MGYCHCTSCRRWSAGPINAFTLWKSEAVAITRAVLHIHDGLPKMQDFPRELGGSGVVLPE